MSSPGPLGLIYTLQEAADYLKTTKHAVSRAARKAGIGAAFGRDIRFNSGDLTRIWDTMAIRANHPLRASASPSFADEKAWASLRKMAQDKRAATLRSREARRKGRQ